MITDEGIVFLSTLWPLCNSWLLSLVLLEHFSWLLSLVLLEHFSWLLSLVLFKHFRTSVLEQRMLSE
jgi:hypothetical protein